ncbi:MAG: SIMPL domain-containing protein [Anaerolineales bacterium]
MKTNRVRNSLLALSAIGLVGVLTVSQGLWPRSVAADTAQTTESTVGTRSITVVGKGTVTAKPDTAMATLGVETMGKSVKEATSESATIMTAILKALAAQGIAERDIQTSGYSVWSERNIDSEGNQSDQVTYRVTNTVTVKVRDLAQIGAVLDAAIDAGANSVYGVSFYLDDTAAVETEARKKAMADARAKATELAQLGEVEVGQVLSISEVVGGSVPYTSFNAKEMALASSGGGAGPISAGELDMSLTLQVTYAIE